MYQFSTIYFISIQKIQFSTKWVFYYTKCFQIRKPNHTHVSKVLEVGDLSCYPTLSIPKFLYGETISIIDVAFIFKINYGSILRICEFWPSKLGVYIQICTDTQIGICPGCLEDMIIHCEGLCLFLMIALMFISNSLEFTPWFICSYVTQFPSLI